MLSNPKPTARSPFVGDLPPHLPCRKGEVAKDVLLPGDPDRVALFAEMMDDVEDYGRRREFAVIKGKFKGRELTVCSTGIGGPSTEIALVELAALGAKRVIRVGGMSSLVESLDTGSFICVERAVGYSSVASLYGTSDACEAKPDSALFQSLMNTTPYTGCVVKQGTVGSTDSYYLGQDRPLSPTSAVLPTSNYLEELKKLGAVGVDMECQTVLTVSQSLGLKAACLLGVHGNRVTNEWLVNYESTQRSLLKIAASALMASDNQPPTGD